MSKTWYYEVMGAELGPISSTDLIDKAKRGQIQPDTRVRSGPEGKWQFAERVKGLFPPPPAPPRPMVTEVTPSPVQRSQTIPLAEGPGQAGESDKTYHFTGDSSQQTTGVASRPESLEFEFFEFIGFSQAISAPLHAVLLEYARKHELSVTQITRRALAEFLGRKDLAEDSPGGAAPTPPTSAES